jgi:hypothetical protein
LERFNEILLFRFFFLISLSCFFHIFLPHRGALGFIRAPAYGEKHKKRREHMATFCFVCRLFFSLIYFVKRGIHWHGEGAQKMGKGDQPNSDTKSIFRIQNSIQKS